MKTDENIVIRKACISDVPEMISLLEILFSIEKDFKFNPSLHEKGLKLILKSENALLVVAENAEKKVVGMASAQIVISTAEGAPSAWIEDVVILPEWRGKGIGKKLLSELEIWARSKGATRLQLLADSTNSPALSFYSKLNWITTRMICLKKKL